MGFYVESADRPYISRIASEDIHVGTLVEENSDSYRLADAQNVSNLRYLATKPRSADHIADDEDATSSDTYASADNDRVPALPLSDGDLVKVRTATDPDGNESSPSISDGDVVGVIDSSAGTLSTASAYHGRVVEEGYVDGDGVTYNRSNNNFVALGTAERDEASSYDAPIRVRVEGDL